MLTMVNLPRITPIFTDRPHFAMLNPEYALCPAQCFGTVCQSNSFFRSSRPAPLKSRLNYHRTLHANPLMD